VGGAGGTTVIVTARGQTISTQFPVAVFIPENTTTSQITFRLNTTATPGDHSIDATLGSETKTVMLTIT